MADPTGISQIVIENLVNKGIDELKAIYQCKDKGKALEDFINNVRRMVSDASGTAQAGHPVKEWLDKLNRVLDKAEQEISKCKDVRRWNILKILETRRVSKRISKITGELQDIFRQAALAGLNVAVQTNQTAHEVKQDVAVILEILDEIKEKIDRDGHGDAQQILDNLRQLPNKIFGTDATLADVENLLLSETGNKWVGVWGRGGIGKTLLAERTFNSTKVRQHFQQQFWVTVGCNPSIEQLQKNLAQQMEVDIQNTAPDEAKTRLSNALEGKNVLLILDDMWDDKVDVLGLLDVTRGTHSKILVTTRDIKVLKKCHATDGCTVRMECLSNDDSWELFCEHAFRGVDHIPPDLDNDVTKAVADECKGLPLALKVTAGALAHEQSPAIWKRQLKKLKEAKPLDQGHEAHLYGHLQLSYDSLAAVDHRLQKCFIYFAAFPEDYDVGSDQLADLWAGEKLLQAGDDAEDDLDPSVECFYLLSELIGRSLIDLRWSAVDCLRITCRVHDVLRDFARYLIEQKKVPLVCDWICCFCLHDY